MELARLAVLSEQEVQRIHEASLDILASCGVQVLHPGMLGLLKDRGLDVDHQSQTVRFSRGSVEDALAAAPPQFDVFDRNGRFAFVLGDRRPKIACGHEQLLMDEEISAMSLRIAEGMRVTDETMAADVIKAAGPHGENYLTHDHTLQWLRSDEYVRPRLSVVGPRATWEAAGAKDTYQLARERTKKHARREPVPLAARTKARLDEIIASF